MIQDVKLALRITNNKFNEEVEDLIESARLDLIQSGVSKTIAKKEDDPLIKRAIIFYSKAYYGLDNPNAERFKEAYESLRNHLSQAGDYRELV